MHEKIEQDAEIAKQREQDYEQVMNFNGTPSLEGQSVDSANKNAFDQLEQKFNAMNKRFEKLRDEILPKSIKKLIDQQEEKLKILDLKTNDKIRPVKQRQERLAE